MSDMLLYCDVSGVCGINLGVVHVFVALLLGDSAIRPIGPTDRRAEGILLAGLATAQCRGPYQGSIRLDLANGLNRLKG